MAVDNRFWLIEPVEDLPKGNPWDPWFDLCFGMVVRAKDEAEARKLAFERGGTQDKGKAWLDPSLSNCINLLNEGNSEIILESWANS